MTEALPKKKKIHCGDRQHSYVTKHIQEALALPTLKQERILIKTFGFEQEQERLCDIVKIGLKTVGGNAIELPIPLICESLSHQPISTCKSSYSILPILMMTERVASRHNIIDRF